MFMCSHNNHNYICICFILVSAAPPVPRSSSWGWWMIQIGTPIIMLVGIPGNVLSFRVMKSPRFSRKSYSHYLCALAVFDSLVLLGKYTRRTGKLAWKYKSEDGIDKLAVGEKLIFAITAPNGKLRALRRSSFINKVRKF